LVVAGYHNRAGERGVERKDKHKKKKQIPQIDEPLE
jgi:hypothetical protein